MIKDMKKFLDVLSEWKNKACLLFTGSIIIYMAITFTMGESSLKIGAIFSILAISAIGTFVQLVAFTNYIISNASYIWRLIIFLVPFGAFMTVIAALFDWFPAEQPGAWIMFIGMFFAFFAVILVGLEIYYKATGRKYDRVLGQYKKQKEKENN